MADESELTPVPAARKVEAPIAVAGRRHEALEGRRDALAHAQYGAMLNNRPGSAAQRKAAGHLDSRAQRDPPIQRKLRVTGTNAQYSDVSAAKAAGKQAVPESEAYDWTLLDDAIGGSMLFTVKQLADVIALAEGKDAEVLQPLRHVIGEIHTASEFNRIKGEWPGVAAVEEGLHSILETGLVLKKGSEKRSSDKNFADVFQSKSSPELPLENYHAASLARLMVYLAIWNQYEADPNDPQAKTYIVKRAEDVIKIWHAYSSVAASVFMAGMDASWTGWFGPSYAGAIEEAYGAVYTVLTGPNSKAALPCLEEVAASSGLPTVAKKDVAAVRAWISEMVGAVADILKVSSAARSDAKQIGRQTDATKDLATKQPGLAKTDDALKSVNPAREAFMAEHVSAAPLPSLVKVGKAHLPGLKGHRIANAKLHDDAGAFDGALRARASDLGKG